MVRRAMCDPVSWLLVTVAVAISLGMIAGISAVRGAEACVEHYQRSEVLGMCPTSPDRLLVLVEALLACAAWCLVGMRAARLPR